MRVMFVNPGMTRYTRQVGLPLGLISIGTYLETHGHTVKIIDHTVKSSDIKKDLAEFRPDILGVSIISIKSFYDSEKVSLAAKEFGAKVVWGGVLPTMDPDFVFKNIGIDFISVGEGEKTWLELVEALEAGGDAKNVPGLAYYENGEVVYSPERPLMNLADLPPMDFTLVDVEKYLDRMYGCKKAAMEYMAKGCVGNCTFCFNKKFHHGCYRMRPVETFLKEVEFLVKNYGVDCIYFTDELWCKNRGEMLYQCKAFRESGLDFKWGVQTRIGIFSKEDFQIMKDSGCLWIDFGVESGSREMLKKINKGIPYDRIEQTFSDCAEVGIITIANFIVGLPDETIENFKDTVKMASRIKATQKTFFFYMPEAGTKLHGELVKSGRYKTPENFKEYTNVKYFYSPKPNLSEIPNKDLKVVRAHFLWQAFSKKQFNDDVAGHDLAWKYIVAVLKQFKDKDLSFALQLFFISAYEFTDIFFYAHFFPFTKKKYELK